MASIINQEFFHNYFNKRGNDMKLSSIRINPAFLHTSPSETKMNMCRTYFKNHGALDREIVLDHRWMLTDGYVGYLVLKENNIDDVDAYIRVVDKTPDARPMSKPYWQKDTVYVFGKHPNSNKEYVWRVHQSNKALGGCMRVGGKAIVSTRNGNKVVTITKIETLASPPVSMAVKKVIRCLPE